MQNTDGKWIIIIRTNVGERKHLLNEALYSILAQTYSNKQIVIALHSYDNVELQAERLEYLHSLKYMFRDMVDIHIVTADTSKKRGHPFNVALDFVQQNIPDCKYISFLDDDDVYYPVFGKYLISKMQEESLNFAYGNTIVASYVKDALGEMKFLEKKSVYGEIFNAAKLVTNNYITSNQYVYAFSTFGGLRFEENLELLEDWEFLLQMVFSNNIIGKYYDKDLAEYRIPSGSLSHSFNLHQKNSQAQALTFIYNKYSLKSMMMDYLTCFTLCGDPNNILGNNSEFGSSALEKYSQIIPAERYYKYRYHLVDKIFRPFDNNAILRFMLRKSLAFYRKVKRFLLF